MTCVSLGFLGRFLLLTLFASQALAKPATSQMGTSVNQSGLAETKKCNNVYFYEAPNEKIENMLQAVTKQLAHMQKDIDIIKEKKNATKGKLYVFLCALSWFINPFTYRGAERPTRKRGVRSQLAVNISRPEDSSIFVLLSSLNVWYVHQFSGTKFESTVKSSKFFRYSLRRAVSPIFFFFFFFFPCYMFYVLFLILIFFFFFTNFYKISFFI